MTLKERLRAVAYQWEARLKVDVRYIFKGGFWTTFSFATGTLASIASMIAFGNLLPKAEYGIYSYLLSLGSSLAFLTLSGTGPAVVRAVARGHEHLVSYALRLQLRYNLLAVATVAAAGFYYYAKGNALFAICLIVLAAVIPLEAAYHIYEHVLIGKKEFDRIAVISTLSSFASTAATILVLLFSHSVLLLILAYAATSFGPTYIAYRLVSRNIPASPPDTEEGRELRRSAFHITGAGIIGALAQYVDKITLFHFAGPAALATYGFATAGPERMKGFAKNWVNITLPRLAERDVREIRATFYKRILLSLLMGAAGVVAYAVAAPLLFKLLLPKYLDSIIYSQVYALGLLFVPPIVYVGNVFYSQNMLRAIYITSTANQIVRILFVVLGGFFWQTWGLIFGFLLSQGLNTCFNFVVWEWESRKMMRARAS